MVKEARQAHEAWTAIVKRLARIVGMSPGSTWETIKIYEDDDDDDKTAEKLLDRADH